MPRLTHARTYSRADFLTFRPGHINLPTLRPTHTQTDPYSDILMLKLTHTQTYQYLDLLIVWLTQHTTDFEGVSGGALVPAPLRGIAEGRGAVPFAVVMQG
eukprot:4705101-Pyramimonas_sp.AAC.1